MRRLPSAVAQVGLPADVEELLAAVAGDGFTLYCCGPKVAPIELDACYEWNLYVDLLSIRDFDRDRVITARAPKHGRLDIFAPEVVVWAYEGPSQPALRALLDLMHPRSPRGPYRRLSGASEPARSSRSATPDDDVTPITKPGRGSGGPAPARDGFTRMALT